MLIRLANFFKFDKESVHNLILTVKFTTTVTLISSSIYSSYVFYKNDYNIAQTIKHFKRLHYTLNYGKFECRKKPDSFFLLSLSEKLSYQISAYFIQLDLDKENGVTYSDLSKLWDKFELDLDYLNKFIADKQPGNQTERMLCGCSLQTFGEAFESLILKLRTKDRNEALDLEEDLCKRFEEINKLTLNPSSIPFTLSNPHITSSVSEIADKIKFTPKSKDAEEEEVRQKILELHTEMSALEKQISRHKSVKRPLTDAEMTRIRTSQDQLDELKAEIKKLERGLNSWF